eukprot:scaffold11577_cov111-Isochrysis_galbana.AAC.3
MYMYTCSPRALYRSAPVSFKTTESSHGPPDDGSSSVECDEELPPRRTVPSRPRCAWSFKSPGPALFPPNRPSARFSSTPLFPPPPPRFPAAPLASCLPTGLAKNAATRIRDRVSSFGARSNNRSRPPGWASVARKARPRAVEEWRTSCQVRAAPAAHRRDE